MRNYAPLSRIEFERIITNEGGGFISGLNEFWCQVDGLYFFTHTSVAYHPYAHAITEIWMNDAPVGVTAFAANGDTPSATAVVFVHCNSGDKVYIQCARIDCLVFGDADDFSNTTTFSGYLVATETM